ncbi:MAG: FAD-dependent oxidoreductase [Spirochaetales bacterium]|nr:FAD-dependent oxidoreductase [Spirochaetales bacterium]
MSQKFPHLFSPAAIGTLTIKNRVLKAPQSTGMSNMDGTVSDRLVRHYREIARGGTGLIVVEYAYVDTIASKSAHCQLGICDTEHIPGLAWLARIIKAEGSIPGIQIEHCGRQKFLGTKPIKSASRVPWPTLLANHGLDAVPEELTVEEIHEIVERFGDAAVRAVQAGYELVEIHGAHGYLLTNFFSPHTNKRNDYYGGSLENRARIYVEIVRNIRKKIGPRFPLTIRLSGTDYEPDGFPVEDTIELAKILEKEGIDAFHISGGDHHMMIHQVTPMALPVCYNTWAAERIKKEVKVPVIASGSITLPEFAEEIIASGKADFVGLGRPLWADQYWCKKAEDDHPEDIRPCIRCNEGCLERTFFRYGGVTCGVNPTIGAEGLLDLEKAEPKKKVAVVGGGPAGMEAARVCALRGHEVTLFEKERKGGALNEASVPDFKADIRPFMRYLITQIEKLKVKVLEKEVKVDTISPHAFDAVIVASGASPIIPPIPGVDKKHVTDALEVLNKKRECGKKVVVIGGGLVGSETALWLAEQGKDVTVVEMEAEIMKDVAVTDKLAYMDKIAATSMEILTGRKVGEITNQGVSIQDIRGMTREIKADTVVLAVGLKPETALYEELKAKGIPVKLIGDAMTPGKIFDAIHTAYREARII